MKKILFLAVFCFSAITILAQAPLENGRVQLNAGIGTSGWGTPVYVGLDYGVGSNFTVGGELSYRTHNERYDGTYYDYSVTGLGANVNYHFNKVLNIPSQWDFYGGLGLNYYIFNYDDENYNGTEDSDIGLGVQIGGRYFFNKNFGINIEGGGGNATSGAKIGITYKF